MLATGKTTPGEEARTAAILAANLILEHKLLSFVIPRDRKTLLNIAEDLATGLLDYAWDIRRKNELVQVGDVIECAIKNEVITEIERKIVHEMVGNKVRHLRRKGILVGTRGPYGGFKLAPGIRRGDI